jgi:hypothetical protein
MFPGAGSQRSIAEWYKVFDLSTTSYLVRTRRNMVIIVVLLLP